MNSPHKGQWRGALMFSLICARINGWVNNREAGDLRRHPVHCDVIVMHRIFLLREKPKVNRVLTKQNSYSIISQRTKSIILINILSSLSCTRGKEEIITACYSWRIISMSTQIRRRHMVMWIPITNLRRPSHVLQWESLYQYDGVFFVNGGPGMEALEPVIDINILRQQHYRLIIAPLNMPIISHEHMVV